MFLLKTENKQPERLEKEAVDKNYFEINDELAGIHFKVGKNFERMSASQLRMKNFSFIYGFYAKNDESVACFVSQTQREKTGVVTIAGLRDGVFEQAKKTLSDAQLESVEIVDVGENNNKGAKLKIGYTEAKTPKFQWEVAGITEKTASFAFCEFPKAVVDLYQEDINLFLDSVRIK